MLGAIERGVTDTDNVVEKVQFIENTGIWVIHGEIDVIVETLSRTAWAGSIEDNHVIETVKLNE